jgi:16S rRNA (uracil1498-N3)-methyltransferase
VASLRDRFFVEGVHAVGDRVTFAHDDARKIVAVLRGRSGEQVHVVDSGGAAFAAVLEVGGTSVSAQLASALERASRELGTQVTIAQAIPKGQKMDAIVEKATELGAFAIVPLRSARVLGERTGEHKVERWQRIARSAAQQCGRSVVPTIEPIVEWTELIDAFPRYDRVFVPWELAEVRPLRAVFDGEAPLLRSALFVIGPEGGFAADEVERALGAGAHALSLGPRILRTETVALVMLAAFAYARGEL